MEVVEEVVVEVTAPLTVPRGVRARWVEAGTDRALLRADFFRTGGGE